MQATAPGHKFVTWTQIEVIGISQYDGRTDGGQIIRCNCFDRPYRANGHEDGSWNDAMGRGKQASARGAVCLF